MAMDKQFDYPLKEAYWYSFWEKKGYFKTDNTHLYKDDSVYVIPIPPPNVTGTLHLGHALNNNLQDVLARHQRMLGKKVFWVVGTDHAGIATQNVIEKILFNQNKNQSMPLNFLLDEAWRLVRNHHSIIVKQLKSLGSSCDWTEERFTLDKDYAQSVKYAFCKLYHQGLIYKAHYLINWDPVQQTAISDEEVNHREVKGTLYYINYPVVDSDQVVCIATTRPETFFADVAVGVHPDDERYQSLRGKYLELPLIHRKIPIIFDNRVKQDFGTGAVKITPAHDFNDYQLAKTHDLEFINILNKNGTLNENTPLAYHNKTTINARQQVEDELETKGFLVKKIMHTHSVAYADRSGATIEPYMSDQWFLSMDSMAKKALQAFKRKEIKFYPDRWGNTYIHWLKQIKDWCISRQLWWGHSIPAWYNETRKEYIVPPIDNLDYDPNQDPQYVNDILKAETDVLDTWFSSWLWPFAIFNWPQSSRHLSAFFPTSVVVTAYDIIFFWVARMVMGSLHFLDEVPFKDIYITSLIRDKKGRKMSKSLGNGVDPLDLVKKYGSDALKFTLVFHSVQGQDIYFEEETIQVGYRLVNKIWNAARFIDTAVKVNPELFLEDFTPYKEVYNDCDHWIFISYQKTVNKVKAYLKNYQFSEAASAIYHFFWDDFCDWYIEYSKFFLYSSHLEDRNIMIWKLVSLFRYILILLHPFFPYLTEELYHNLPNQVKDSIMEEKYPSISPFFDEKRYFLFQEVKQVINKIRQIRHDLKLPIQTVVTIQFKFNSHFKSQRLKKFMYHKENIFFIKQMGVVKNLINEEDSLVNLENMIRIIRKSILYELNIYFSYIGDMSPMIQRFQLIREKGRKLKEEAEKKLNNSEFQKNAPPQIIDKEKQKIIEADTMIDEANIYLSDLNHKV